MSRMMPMEPSFIKALPIIEKIASAGYEAYFVGGSVRDTLLHKKIHDVDIATSAYPEEMKQLFKKTIDVGIEHGTVMIAYQGEMYEITTFRTESTYQDFRRPDSVTFVRSLEEDLKRRDFTINALAMTSEGKIIDYFDGLKDLKEKRIKAVGEAHERFHEDALRMMRAVRFVSQLQFHLEPATKEAICEHHALLSKIAVERIQVEFTKLLMGPGRKEGLQTFVETGLYAYCPGLAGEKAQVLAFSKIEGTFQTETEAWVLLIWSLKLPVPKVDAFMRAWKCSKKESRMVEAIYDNLLTRNQRDLTTIELYSLGLEAALLTEKAVGLLGKVAKEEKIQQRYADLPIHSISELAITGKDLLESFNRKPGKWVGEFLEIAERAAVERRIENTKAALLSFLEKQRTTQNEEKH